MKNLFLIALVWVGQIIILTAQTNPTNPNTNSTTTVNNARMSDYERQLQHQQKVEFRTQASKTLGLSEKQIKDFDPLYNSYMKEKSELAQARIKLLNEYMEEIAENDSPSNEENDKEEFLEDYIELQIKEMELRKKYFDKMEDVITADNAFGFYLIEDMAAHNIYNQILNSRFAPFTNQQWHGSSNTSPSNSSNNSMNNQNNSMDNPSNRSTTTPSYNDPKNPNPTMERDNTTVSHSNTAPSTTNSSNTTGSPSSPPTNSNSTGNNPTNATNGNMNNTNYAGTTPKTLDRRYRADIDGYSTWVKNTKVVVDNKHQYTHDGLNKLVTAISSMSTACGMANDNAFTSNKHKIITNATELQKDPSSMEHSKLMRESFIMAADMLKSMQKSCGQNSSASNQAVSQLAETARKLDVNKTTHSQQQHIKDFFQQSQQAIDAMANGMTWSSGK